MANHAVVIGINNYPGLSHLGGPCNDAQAFLQWVERPGPGDVDPLCVHKLLSTDFPAAADVLSAMPMSDQISGLFEKILKSSPNQHVGDRLYVFVAGHGMSDVNHLDSAALIAANATRLGIALPHVVITDYIHYFRKSYTFKEIILIMDCCLDATVLRPLNVTGLLQGPLHPRASSVRMFLAKGTVWGQKSFEKDFNGTTKGIFSVTFMEALAKAPAEGTKVTGRAIRNFIDQYIQQIAGEKEVDIPTISGREYEKIVFYERNAAQTDEAASIAITVNIDSPHGNEVVDLYDGSLVLRESKTVENGKVIFTAPAGIYKVGIRGTMRQALIEVVQDYEETL